ncbi:MAG TPA: hypothetical protein VIG74_06305, partial [Alphaproteobacteria bacterium]
MKIKNAAMMSRTIKRLALAVLISAIVAVHGGIVRAAVASLAFTVNMSESVAVDTAGGTPRIAIDVGGATRYATYASGSGSAALVFAYTPLAGDVDLDGITLISPLDLNGGTIRDLAGNDAALTYTLPTTTGVKVDYPSLSADFINDRYTFNGAAYNSLPSFLTASGGTFARASVATYFDSAGTMQTASANTPRFDYDPSTLAAKGLLIEENKTNVVANSTMQGAIAGTPGTLPTGWFIAFNPAGFSYQILGTGVEKGMTYIDIRFYGNTSANEVQLAFGPSTAATAGQLWTSSFYIRRIAGSNANLSNIRSRITWGNPGYLAQSNAEILANVGGASLFRGIVTATAPATTTVNFSILNLIASAAGADITLRIAAPQREI